MCTDLLELTKSSIPWDGKPQFGHHSKVYHCANVRCPIAVIRQRLHQARSEPSSLLPAPAPARTPPCCLSPALDLAVQSDVRNDHAYLARILLFLALCSSSHSPSSSMSGGTYTPKRPRSPFFRGLLFICASKVYPASGALEHVVQVVNASCVSQKLSFFSPMCRCMVNPGLTRPKVFAGKS